MTDATPDAIKRLPRLPVWGSLAAHLILAIVLLIAFIGILGTIVVWRAEQAAQAGALTRDKYEAAANTDRADTYWLTSSSVTGAYLLFHDPTYPDLIQQIQQQTLAEIDKAIGVERRLGEGDDVDSLVAIRAQIVQVQDLTNRMVDAANAGDSATVQQLTPQIISQGSQLEPTLRAFGDHERADVSEASADSARAASTLTWVLIAAIMTIIIAGAGAAYYVARAVMRPLSHLRHAANAIGRGDLSVRAELLGPREIREMAAAFNHTISEIEDRDGALRASEAYWHSLIENAQDVIAVIDAQGLFQFVSPAIKNILGYEPESLVGRVAISIVHPEDRQRAMQALSSVSTIDGGEDRAPTELRMLSSDGQWLYIEGKGTLVHGETGDLVVINARDITGRRKAEETIAHMAYHDSLTSLPNRLLLADRLALAVAQARRGSFGVCVISLDIDRFKTVNDLLGHGAGDDLLKQVAARLSNLVRDGDTVARLGGDEFVLLFPDCPGLDNGEATCQRIVEGFRRPFRVAEREIHVTVSAGLARFPDHGASAESLISSADVALYAAKDAGRNTFRVYSDEMARRSGEWFALESQLRRALVNGEILVYYQPQVRVDSGEVIGAEALARWQHPERGLMLPTEFIPLAEETGLINMLGELVLQQACTDAMSWPQFGPDPLRVSVNVSLRQFERPDFVDRVLTIVAGTGLPPQRLELEITESTALRDIDRTRKVATSLTEAGILLSIDDFGAGNTSLRHLQDLPLHQLKIDQSFILKLLENPANAAIAASVISLGHKLHLNVIAEGVETKEQLQFLRDQDCDEFQGFICSEPMPAAEFLAMIARTAEPAVASDPA